MRSESDPSPLLRARVRSEREGKTIFLEGELDMATAPHLDEALRTAMRADPPGLVVDLSGLTFMDSTGVKALLKIAEECRAEGRRLAVVPGGRRIQRTIEICGLADRFDWVPAAEDPNSPAGTRLASAGGQSTQGSADAE